LDEYLRSSCVSSQRSKDRTAGGASSCRHESLETSSGGAAFPSKNQASVGEHAQQASCVLLATTTENSCIFSSSYSVQRPGHARTSTGEILIVLASSISAGAGLSGLSNLQRVVYFLQGPCIPLLNGDGV